MPKELFPVGSQGMMAPRIGVGVMSVAFYGSGSTAADEAAQLEALDKLVAICAPNPAFIDTAWMYSHPTGLHSEEIIAKAVQKHGRAAFVIATKFGATGGTPTSSTAYIHSNYADSARRLGCAPDLYYQHRPDANRRIEDVVGDLKAMIAEGKIKYIGLSECTADELRRAHAVHPVTAIQVEWSLMERGVEAGLMPTCIELGVAIVPYSPLSRGMLTNATVDPASLDATDRRRVFPRFKDGVLDTNLRKAALVRSVAERKWCTVAQVALAWLLAKGPFVFPIPGSKTAARVAENLAATDVILTREEMADLDALGTAAVGDRQIGAGMLVTWEARTKAA